MRHIAIVCGCAMAAGAASGQMVMLSDEASITETGQTFVFDFSGVAAAISGGTLLLEALGDYSIVPPSGETLSWDVDGIASGVGFAESAFVDPDNVDLFQNAASQSFSISLADMQAITADGSVTITLQNSGSVNFFSDQPDDFVRATLTYSAVPTPGAVAMIGAAGLAAARRRR